MHFGLGRDYVTFAFIYVRLNPGMEVEKDIFACALKIFFFLNPSLGSFLSDLSFCSVILS